MIDKQKLKENAGYLRNHSTLSEVLLWKKIKNRQIKNYKFLRQKVIGGYIIDFYCHSLKLAIEIDGGSHYENEVYDQNRDMELKKSGINILHISDKSVKQNIEGVILEIKDWITKNE